MLGLVSSGGGVPRGRQSLYRPLGADAELVPRRNCVAYTTSRAPALR